MSDTVAVKALTIRQPWASLLALGYKRTETRSWDTRVRGPVAIHAGLAMPCRRGESIEVGEFTVERDSGGLLLRGPRLARHRLPLGAVVAVGELFQTRRTDSTEHHPDDMDRALGDHSPGRYAWSITSMCPLRTPIPATGRLGWWAWDCPTDVAADLRYPLLRGDKS